MDYFSDGTNRWWRAGCFQLGYYPRGRRPPFSERQGWRRPPRRIRIGRREITFSRLRRIAP